MKKWKLYLSAGNGALKLNKGTNKKPKYQFGIFEILNKNKPPNPQKDLRTSAFSDPPQFL